MPEASPRSVTRSSSAPVPRSFHVSQSCGRHTAAVRAAFSGSWVASQRSFVAVIDATGSVPVASAHSCAPSSATRSAADCAERVSFHSSAGRTTSPSASRHTMPCCWPATAIASTPSRPPACGQRGLQRVPPARRVDLGAGGCGARPDRTCSPVVASRMTTVQDCVDESTPATRLMDVTQARLGWRQGALSGVAVESRGEPPGRPCLGTVASCAWRPGTSTPPSPGCRGCCRGSTSGRPTSSASRRRSCPTRRSPRALDGPLAERGYAYAHVGEGRWNGVAILSRVGLDDVQRALPGARLLRHRRGPRGDGDLRRPAGHVRLRAERAHPRRPALRVQAGVAGGVAGVGHRRPRRAWSRAT